MISYYETKENADNRFPIIFHTDRMYENGNKEHAEINIKNNMLGTNRLHWHECVEILRFTKGNGSVYIDTQRYNVSKGDIIVVNSNQLHRIEVAETECVYNCLRIDYNLCLDWGYDIYNIFYNTLIKDDYLNDLFDKLTDEYYSERQFYKTFVTAFCMEIIALLTRKYTTDGNSIDTSLLKKMSIVRRVMQYINHNYDSPQILNELSIDLKYSQYYLAHIFSEFTGLSIKEYQMQIRFHIAKKELAESKNSVAEIAQSCGYNNSGSFTAEFRRRNGKTPLEYRNSKQ